MYNGKVTLLATIWKRRKHLEEFISRWLAQPEIDEIILWDNSGEYELKRKNDRIKLIRSSYNFGSYPRDVVAHFAKNDVVICADDDILVEPGFVADLLKYYSEDMLLGIWGRIFGNSYHHSNSFRADRIKEPMEVDFVVGLVWLINRKYLLPIDHRDFKWTCYDLHFNGELKKQYPQVKRMIVPTNKWKQTEEETDEWALNSHPDAFKEKQELFERYFANGK